MKKYSAFTFAELMISLTIISVLAALLYPAISRYSPNTNKPLFQAAYKSLTITISEILNTSLSPELDTTAETSGHTLCVNFCNRANVINRDNDTCTQLCTDDDNELTTNNGMRWHFANFAGNVFRISVDVNASNNNIASENHDNNIHAFDDNGVFSFDNGTGDNGIYKNGNTFNKEHLKTQDSFWITIDKTGKLVDMSPAGWAHLEDTPDTAD